MLHAKKYICLTEVYTTKSVNLIFDFGFDDI